MKQKNHIWNIRTIGVVILLMTTMLTTVSCSKERQIVGSWRITSFVVGNIENDMPGKIWTFNDNGSCYLAFASETLIGQWSVDGDNLNIYGSMEGYDYFNISMKIEKIKNKTMTLSGNMYMNWEANYYVIATFSRI